MTTIEAPVALGPIETAGDQQPVNQVSISPSKYTPCVSYREASSLAGAGRRDGRDTSAVFHVAMNCWCVRGQTGVAGQRSHGEGSGGEA